MVPGLGTVLITNGNLLSMLSLGNWLAEYAHALQAVFVTTRLPRTKSNVGGVFDMCRRSGLSYTYFKLNTNRFLSARLAARGLPTTVPHLVRHFGLPAPVVYVPNINAPWVIELIRSYAPDILLSFSATSRFCDRLIEVPSRVAINVHYALLPQYAGLSPYYWYLHHGEAACGVTMHVIRSQLDAGPIIRQEQFRTEGIRSVLGLLARQMELVSPLLGRFYSGDLHERDAVPQDLTRRSYYRHPGRADVREFRRRRLVFSTRTDVARLATMAASIKARAGDAAQVLKQGAAVGVTPAAAEENAAFLGRSWYVPPESPPKRGWLVYSLDFVLATLQGSITEPQNVRRTPAWVVLGRIVQATMAIAQLIIMVVARLPIVSWFLETLARTFTRNAFGFFLRSCYWKARLKRLGQDTIIDRGVGIWGPANVSIGSHSHIDTNVRLAAGERRHGQRGWIVIGDHVHVGPGAHVAGRGGVVIQDMVGISANAHLYSATNVVEKPDDPGELISLSHMAPPDRQQVLEAPIIVEQYAFIGMMARIMPGVRIGRAAIIHANCELTHSVPPFANVGGVGGGRQIGWRLPRRCSPNLAGDRQPEQSAEEATSSEHEAGAERLFSDAHSQ